VTLPDPATLTLTLISVALIILISFPVHEFSHAFAAFRLGDSTARWQGRLTLDPRAHFDPVGALALTITGVLGSGIGWAKPTPVNPYNLRYGRRGEALVALAGPISNLLIGAAMAIPLRLIWSDPALRTSLLSTAPGAIAWDIALIFFSINISLFVFNFVPIPPLDGWKVMLGLVDARTAFQLRQVEQYAIILLFAVILVGGRVIAPIIGAVVEFFVPGARLVAW
jgi:Zn-dependent protease